MEFSRVKMVLDFGFSRIIDNPFDEKHIINKLKNTLSPSVAWAKKMAPNGAIWAGSCKIPFETEATAYLPEVRLSACVQPPSRMGDRRRDLEEFFATNEEAGIERMYTADMPYYYPSMARAVESGYLVLGHKLYMRGGDLNHQPTLMSHRYHEDQFLLTCVHEHWKDQWIQMSLSTDEFFGINSTLPIAKNKRSTDLAITLLENFGENVWEVCMNRITLWPTKPKGESQWTDHSREEYSTSNQLMIERYVVNHGTAGWHKCIVRPKKAVWLMHVHGRKAAGTCPSRFFLRNWFLSNHKVSHMPLGLHHRDKQLCSDPEWLNEQSETIRGVCARFCTEKSNAFEFSPRTGFVGPRVGICWFHLRDSKGRTNARKSHEGTLLNYAGVVRKKLTQWYNVGQIADIENEVSHPLDNSHQLIADKQKSLLKKQPQKIFNANPKNWEDPRNLDHQQVDNSFESENDGDDFTLN